VPAGLFPIIPAAYRAGVRMAPFRITTALALCLAASACPPAVIVPVLPALTPAQDNAVRSTLAAAASPNSSIGIPPRPCPEHTARTDPDGKCRPLPCGGQCREGQRCDETAIVPRCVVR